MLVAQKLFRFYGIAVLFLAWISCNGMATAQETRPSIDMLTENVGIGVIARNLKEFNLEFSEICRKAQIPLGDDSLAMLF